MVRIGLKRAASKWRQAPIDVKNPALTGLTA
jgi:hypothetical protein